MVAQQACILYQHKAYYAKSDRYPNRAFGIIIVDYIEQC